ncbi:Hypothetical protein FKW44_007210 [Caligus rogercresseyi]|uniref:Uncharacterized protein n=1 Tax=Caligus rogercresseyi TaxID=217165 RepID=A0A7T8KEF1_CALRO|nr:Hypothetical protein FKW44_007210 [Caligus rogercresseyi]
MVQERAEVDFLWVSKTLSEEIYTFCALSTGKISKQTGPLSFMGTKTTNKKKKPPP